jgi:hypothetical protein
MPGPPALLFSLARCLFSPSFLDSTGGVRGNCAFGHVQVDCCLGFSSDVLLSVYAGHICPGVFLYAVVSFLLVLGGVLVSDLGGERDARFLGVAAAAKGSKFVRRERAIRSGLF